MIALVANFGTVNGLKVPDSKTLLDTSLVAMCVTVTYRDRTRTKGEMQYAAVMALCIKDDDMQPSTSHPNGFHTIIPSSWRAAQPFFARNRSIHLSLQTCCVVLIRAVATILIGTIKR
eukprot:scaffold541_cov138-Cylindrotheca_fusiformis.AAC.9